MALYGICYIPYIASSFIMLGLIFQWLNSEKRYARVLLLGLVVGLSVLLGMGGVRQLMVFYALILCTAVICMVIHYREFKKYNLYYFEKIEIVRYSYSRYSVMSITCQDSRTGEENVYKCIGIFRGTEK